MLKGGFYLQYNPFRHRAHTREVFSAHFRSNRLNFIELQYFQIEMSILISSKAFLLGEGSL